MALEIAEHGNDPEYLKALALKQAKAKMMENEDLKLALEIAEHKDDPKYLEALALREAKAKMSGNADLMLALEAAEHRDDPEYLKAMALQKGKTLLMQQAEFKEIADTYEQVNGYEKMKTFALTKGTAVMKENEDYMQPDKLMKMGTSYAIKEFEEKQARMIKYQNLMIKTKGDPNLLLEELKNDPELQKELMEAALFPYNKMAEEALE